MRRLGRITMKTLIFVSLFLSCSTSYSSLGAGNVRLPCGAVIHPAKSQQDKAAKRVADMLRAPALDRRGDSRAIDEQAEESQRNRGD